MANDPHESSDFRPAPADPPADPAIASVGWAVAARLAFLEEQVWWTDRVNRRDLAEHFGISEQQASADFTRYQELLPDNLVYDRSAKAYRGAPLFQPVFFDPDSQAALGRFRLVAEHVTEADWLSSQMRFDIAGAPARPVAAPVLRLVVRAIRERRQLSAWYVSFTSTEGRMRLIEPHALVYDGFRWHARARDAESGAFRDYVLGRLSKVDLGGPAGSTEADDADWNTFVILAIGANPRLPDAQRRVIERDYGMSGGRVEIRVRRALRFYTMVRLGLDLAPDARPPEDQHIVLIEERAGEA